MSKGAVYERQVDNVLTGGWNLLPPGDLLAPAEALQCENFRIDTAGNLRSRYGRGGAVWEPGTVRRFCEVKGVGVRRYAATYDGQLWRDGLRIDSGEFGPGPIGLASYQGFLWAMGRNAQKKDNGAALLNWTPTAPADPVVTPAAGGLLEDATAYTYWITYAATGGQESPSNAEGTTVVTGGGNLTNVITSPAASGDTQVIGWNVYRIGNTLQEALRLNSEVIAIATDFTDTGDPGQQLGDLALTRIGIALDPNAAGPPAGNGLAGPYYEHLLAWGVAAHPNRLYWAGTLQPYNFPGSDLDEGNHVDIGELGDAIVGVTIRPRYATVYKDSSIWRLVGDPDDLDGDLEQVTDELGAIGGQAITTVGGIDYFQGPEGLYANSGEKPRKITGKLDALFRGERPAPAGFAFSTGIRLNQNPVALQRNCMAHRRGRLYFFYCGGDGASFPNRGITQELGADNWGSDSRPITAILNEGTEAVDEATAAPTGSGLLVACVDGGVVALEEGFRDDGTPIPVSYHSGYKDQGAPDNLKTYVDVVIKHNTGDAQLTVKAFYNGGVGPVPDKLSIPEEALGVIQSVSETTSIFQCSFGGDYLGIKARNIAIRIEGEASASAPALIYKVLVHYFIEARDSKTYVSDETDLGDERVKLIAELELDIDFPAEGGGSTVWGVYADGGTGAIGGGGAGAVITPGLDPVVPDSPIPTPVTIGWTSLGEVDYPAVAWSTGFVEREPGEYYFLSGLSLRAFVGDASHGISPQIAQIGLGLGYPLLATVHQAPLLQTFAATPSAAFLAQWPQEAYFDVVKGILAGLVPAPVIPDGFETFLNPAPPVTPGPPVPPPDPEAEPAPVAALPSLTLRDYGNVPPTAGRQIIRIPLPGTPAGPIEGRLTRVTLRNDLTFFRLYGVRLRVLPYGEFMDNLRGEVFETLNLNIGAE